MKCDALKDWKLNIFKIIDRRISFFFLKIPRQTKISYRYLKLGIQEFHRKYVLVPVDKAANKVVVVLRLHYIKTLKQERSGTKVYEQTSAEEKSLISHHVFKMPPGLVLVLMKTKRDFQHSIGYLICTNNHIRLALELIPAHSRLPNYLNR